MNHWSLLSWDTSYN